MKPKISPTVVILSWVSFWADICSEMVYPVIPIFVVGVLKAPAAALGLGEGLAESLVAFVKGWSGRSSDLTGRRMPYVRVGYTLSALGKPLIGLAGAWPMVAFARSLDRFGKGVRGTARDAMIVDATEPEHQGRAFGFNRALDTAGALVGVLIGYALLTAFPNQLRQIFFWAGIPGLIAVLITLAVKDRPKAPVEREAAKKFRPSGPFLKALAITTLFALANSSDTFMLLRASDRGFNPGQVALLYALETLVYAALSYPVGVLSDRLGRIPLLIVGWTIYGLVYLGLALAPGVSFAWLLASYGVYLALNDAVGKALIADVAPRESRGTAMGLFAMIAGFATLASSVLAGLLYDRVDHAAPFWLGAALAFLAAALAPFARAPRARIEG